MKKMLDDPWVETSCELCGKQIKNRRSLGNHLARSHDGWDVERYTLLYLHAGVVPLCACGCGERVSWHKLLYRFNEYINGHNRQFSSSNQPEFSRADVERRNEAIRCVYSERGDDIKQKISQSLKSTFKDPKHRKRMKEHANQMWSKQDHKDLVSQRQHESWVEGGQDRYDRVFTPQMRAKIAHANATRDVKRRSKKEEKLLQLLVERLDVPLQGSHWINTDDGSKCFDALVPEWNLLLEFDGVFWHGLDRTTNFTPVQLHNMANDRRKNRLALDQGRSLIRISMSDQNMQKIENSETVSLADLQELAYYVQLDGRLVIDNTFRFESDDHALLTRNELLRRRIPSLGGVGNEEFEKAWLEPVVEFFQEYLMDQGWLLPHCNDTIDDMLSNISRLVPCKGPKFSSKKRLGNDFLKSQFLSFWSACNGPATTCTDPVVLRSVLSYRLGINSSKNYTYKLDDGTTVVTNETFNVTPSTVRTGFTVQRRVASWFNPCTARDIWAWLHSLLPNEGSGVLKPTVWDPSAGWGARLLGFAAAFPGGNYVGCDPAEMTFQDLERLAGKLRASRQFNGHIELHQVPSEEFQPTSPVDVVFTSPPYHDKERYFEEDTQCWKRYRDLASWQENYVRLTVLNAYAALRQGGIMGLNVPHDLSQLFASEALSVGFEQLPSGVLSTGSDHFHRSSGTDPVGGETILIFRR